MQLRLLKTEMIVIGAVLLAQFGPPITGAITLAALTAWALGGGVRTLHALTLSILIIFFNPGITADRPWISLLKYVLLYTAFARVIIDAILMKVRIPKVLYGVAVFSCTVAILAALVSSHFTVSLLKIINFTVGVFLTIILFKVIPRRIALLDWFYTTYVVVLVISLSVIWQPFAYHRNVNYFQGILNHPQAYSVYLAPMTSCVLVTLLTGEQRTVEKYVVAGLALVTMFLSGSRTGFMALTVGVLATMVAMQLRRDLRQRLMSMRSFTGVVVGSLAILIALLVSGDGAFQGVMRFLAKSKGGVQEQGMETVTSSVARSREQQVQLTLENIRDSPIIGVGFGMSSKKRESAAEVEKYTGLPLSAPAETGFLPTAVLSQTGLVGFVVLFAILWMLFWPILKMGSSGAIALAVAALMVNMGEMVFFSIGGLGLQIWLLFGACHVRTLVWKEPNW